MKRYEVTINNQKPLLIDAGRAAVAVHRAMDHFVEGEFKPVATIKVKFAGKVVFGYDIIADVPFDYGENGKGRKRETVLSGFTDLETAEAEAQRIRAAHPDWDFIKPVRRKL